MSGADELWDQIGDELERLLGELAPQRAVVDSVSGGLVKVKDLYGQDLGVYAQIEGWRDLKAGDEVLVQRLPGRGLSTAGGMRIVQGAIQRLPVTERPDPPAHRDLIDWRAQAGGNNGKAGTLFWPLDAPALSRSNGAGWNPYGPIFPLSPAPTAGWLWDPIGAANSWREGDALALSFPNVGTSNNLRILRRVYGQATVTVTAHLTPTMSTKNYQACGLVVRATGSDAAITFGPSFGGNVAVNRWTSPNVFSATMQTVPVNGWPGWYQLQDDGTNLIFRVGATPWDWVEVYREARTALMANPNMVGVYGNAVNAAAPNLDLGLLVSSWAQGA